MQFSHYLNGNSFSIMQYRLPAADDSVSKNALYFQHKYAVITNFAREYCTLNGVLDTFHMNSRKLKSRFYGSMGFLMFSCLFKQPKNIFLVFSVHIKKRKCLSSTALTSRIQAPQHLTKNWLYFV